MHRQVHFTRAGTLRPLVRYLDRLGMPVERHLHAAGLSPGLLEHADTLVPFALALGFVGRTVRAEGIDNLGLRAGMATSLADLGTFGRLLSQADTLMEYFSHGCRLIPQVTSAERYWLAAKNGDVSFFHEVMDIDSPAIVDDHAYTLAITINTMRRALGDQWSPSEICLPNLEARDADFVGESLGVQRILTGGPFAYMTFSRDVLAAPFSPDSGIGPRRRRQTFSFAQPADFPASMAALVDALVLDGHARIEIAAAALGARPRSLQRRLAAHALSFSDMVRRARMRLARRWLAEGRSVTEIAVNLGYRETANFTRAFRIAHGMPPTAFRNGTRHGK
jgi:AraC-like DNA-binding protein